MIDKLKYSFFWLKVQFTIIMVYISIALRNTELAILRPVSEEMLEKQRHIQRMRHRNQLLEKFYAGQRDEKYVQDYYELLKKADKFIRTSSAYKYATTADKHGMLYGQKDKWGRRYEHFGFFDEGHKHKGKTLGEVLELEIEQRRTKDDTFELIYIFNNKPTEVGIAEVLDVVEEKIVDDKTKYELQDIKQMSKKFKFPIKVNRKNKNCLNKIEELSEFLHVKKVGFEFRKLEFFIPLKFKTNELADDSKIFKEIIDVDEVHIKGKYGELISFGVTGFTKRMVNENNTHEVIKFDGFEMEIIT
jgi:hypothetical protein